MLETPQTVAPPEKKKAANLPNEVTLGDIPSVKVAFKRVVIFTCIVLALMLFDNFGLDSIWLSVFGSAMFFIWLIFVIVLIIAIIKRFIDSASEAGRSS